MTNIDIMNDPKVFIEAYEKAKAETQKHEKKPINSSTVSLEDQLRNFEAFSFTEEDTRALHEDMLVI